MSQTQILDSLVDGAGVILQVTPDVATELLDGELDTSDRVSNSNNENFNDMMVLDGDLQQQTGNTASVVQQQCQEKEVQQQDFQEQPSILDDDNINDIIMQDEGPDINANRNLQLDTGQQYINLDLDVNDCHDHNVPGEDDTPDNSTVLSLLASLSREHGPSCSRDKDAQQQSMNNGASSGPGQDLDNDIDSQSESQQQVQNNNILNCYSSDIPGHDPDPITIGQVGSQAQLLTQQQNVNNSINCTQQTQSQSSYISPVPTIASISQSITNTGVPQSQSTQSHSNNINNLTQKTQSIQSQQSLVSQSQQSQSLPPLPPVYSTTSPINFFQSEEGPKSNSNTNSIGNTGNTSITKQQFKSKPSKQITFAESIESHAIQIDSASSSNAICFESQDDDDIDSNSCKPTSSSPGNSGPLQQLGPGSCSESSDIVNIIEQYNVSNTSPSPVAILYSHHNESGPSSPGDIMNNYNNNLLMPMAAANQNLPVSHSVTVTSSTELGGPGLQTQTGTNRNYLPNHNSNKNQIKIRTNSQLTNTSTAMSSTSNYSHSAVVNGTACSTSLPQSQIPQTTVAQPGPPGQQQQKTRSQSFFHSRSRKTLSNSHTRQLSIALFSSRSSSKSGSEPPSAKKDNPSTQKDNNSCNTQLTPTLQPQSQQQQPQSQITQQAQSQGGGAGPGGGTIKPPTGHQSQSQTRRVKIQQSQQSQNNSQSQTMTQQSQQQSSQQQSQSQQQGQQSQSQQGQQQTQSQNQQQSFHHKPFTSDEHEDDINTPSNATTVGNANPCTVTDITNNLNNHIGQQSQSQSQQSQSQSQSHSHSVHSVLTSRHSQYNNQNNTQCKVRALSTESSGRSSNSNCGSAIENLNEDQVSTNNPNRNSATVVTHYVGSPGTVATGDSQYNMNQIDGSTMLQQNLQNMIMSNNCSDNINAVNSNTTQLVNSSQQQLQTRSRNVNSSQQQTYSTTVSNGPGPKLSPIVTPQQTVPGCQSGSGVGHLNGQQLQQASQSSPDRYSHFSRTSSFGTNHNINNHVQQQLIGTGGNFQNLNFGGVGHVGQSASDYHNFHLQGNPVSTITGGATATLQQQTGQYNNSPQQDHVQQQYQQQYSPNQYIAPGAKTISTSHNDGTMLNHPNTNSTVTNTLAQHNLLVQNDNLQQQQSQTVQSSTSQDNNMNAPSCAQDQINQSKEKKSQTFKCFKQDSTNSNSNSSQQSQTQSQESMRIRQITRGTFKFMLFFFGTIGLLFSGALLFQHVPFFQHLFGWQNSPLQSQQSQQQTPTVTSKTTQQSQTDEDPPPPPGPALNTDSGKTSQSSNPPVQIFHKPLYNIGSHQPQPQSYVNSNWTSKPPLASQQQQQQQQNHNDNLGPGPSTGLPQKQNQNQSQGQYQQYHNDNQQQWQYHNQCNDYGPGSPPGPPPGPGGASQSNTNTNSITHNSGSGSGVGGFGGGGSGHNNNNDNNNNDNSLSSTPGGQGQGQNQNYNFNQGQQQGLSVTTANGGLLDSGSSNTNSDAGSLSRSDEDGPPLLQQSDHSDTFLQKSTILSSTSNGPGPQIQIQQQQNLSSSENNLTNLNFQGSSNTNSQISLDRSNDNLLDQTTGSGLGGPGSTAIGTGLGLTPDGTIFLPAHLVQEKSEIILKIQFVQQQSQQQPQSQPGDSDGQNHGSNNDSYQQYQGTDGYDRPNNHNLINYSNDNTNSQLNLDQPQNLVQGQQYQQGQLFSGSPQQQSNIDNIWQQQRQQITSQQTQSQANTGLGPGISNLNVGQSQQQYSQSEQWLIQQIINGQQLQSLKHQQFNSPRPEYQNQNLGLQSPGGAFGYGQQNQNFHNQNHYVMSLATQQQYQYQTPQTQQYSNWQSDKQNVPNSYGNQGWYQQESQQTQPQSQNWFQTLNNPSSTNGNF